MHTPKEKPKMVAPKVLDKATAVPREAKNILMAQYKERQNQKTPRENMPPEQYAQEQVFDTAKGGGRYIAQAGKRGIQSLRKKAKEGRRVKQEAYYKGDIPREGFYGGSSPSDAKPNKRNPMGSNMAGNKAAPHKAALSRSSGRPTIKTRKAVAQKAVANRAKQVQKQAVKRAVQQTAKAAKTMAKAAARMATNLVKAAVQGLVALLSMGWPVILILIAVALIGGLLCSAFGIFYSGNDTGSIPITQVISEVDSEFHSRIDAAVSEASGGRTVDEVQYGGDTDGDGDRTNNWADVLGVYAVKTTSGVSGQDVVTVTPEKAEMLKSIFWDMNKISVTVKTVTAPLPSPAPSQEPDSTSSPEPETKTVARVTIDSMGYEQAAALYDFDEQQKKLLAELMSPQYYAMFAQLAGVDIYGGMTPDDLAAINANLPVGELGAEIVRHALTRLGDPYSQEKRGTGSYLDCSYLVYWAYKQVGVSIPSTSVVQAKYCSDNNVLISKEQLQPGDLIFWSKTTCNCGRWGEIHHAGMYIGDNKTIEASSSKGRVVINELWGENGRTWRIHSFARPHVKTD